MRRQILLILCIVFGVSGAAFAQPKTVTDADLAKFKEKRVRAEKELRENYRELGFPSPEELRIQNEQSAKELSELSDKLRDERLAREAAKNQEVIILDSETHYLDSNSEKADFIDYQRYFGAAYYYPNYGRNGYYRNPSVSRNNSLRSTGNGFRYRGFIGNRDRTPGNTNFGPSRQLTRQNQIKSRRADRSFRTSLFFGTGKN